MSEPEITLFSSDLLSKWGFNDGNDPHEWFDYCEENGIDPVGTRFPWVEMVRTFLLPLIEQVVTAVDIETNHNPIRVEAVNGECVRDSWHDVESRFILTPEYVDVPMSEALKIVRTNAE